MERQERPTTRSDLYCCCRKLSVKNMLERK